MRSIEIISPIDRPNRQKAVLSGDFVEILVALMTGPPDE